MTRNADTSTSERPPPLSSEALPAGASARETSGEAEGAPAEALDLSTSSDHARNGASSGVTSMRISTAPPTPRKRRRVFSVTAPPKPNVTSGFLSRTTTLDTERRLSWIRVGVVGSGLLIFPFLADQPGYLPLLGYPVIVAGTIYAVAILRFEPYRKYDTLSTAYVTAVIDGLFALTWLTATRGVESPWTVILFLGVVTASLRWTPKATLVAALLYAVGYIAMATFLAQLSQNTAAIAVRLVFLVLVSVATALVSYERSRSVASRLQMLNMMQEVAHVGSWEWSMAGGNLRWSPELHRIFALPHDVTPTFDFYIETVHPEDRDDVLQTLEKAAADGEPFRMDHRILRSDGSVRWLHCRGVVVRDDTGATVEMLGSSQDVTEQKMLEAKLLLSDRLASIGTMASGIAHEINNPLAYVATNLEVIDRKMTSGADLKGIREALDAARHGSDRVRDIVRGLKIFARPEDLAVVPVELSRVVDFAARIVSLEIESRARLVREYEPVGAVLATEARLTQVFVNLLVNAAQAIERGAINRNEIRIRIGSAPGERAFVEIRDTGAGIPAANRERIFDPFFTTKPTGIGTGLGLSICHGIVSDLKGEITVESKVGVGSVFRVTLPVTGAPMVDPTPVPERPPPGPKRSRVLIVDDEVRYASSLKLLLSLDYDVALASDGKRALELFTDGERFDVILCDLMMPRMTGMDLHAALAELAPEQSLRMVFLTGGATNERARAFLARTDIRHLEKPLELPRLEAMIAEVGAA